MGRKEGGLSVLCVPREPTSFSWWLFSVWSKTLSTFIDALFSFSIEKMPVMLSPDDENYPFLPPDEDSYYSHDFTEQDIEFLSKWPEFVFPVMKGTEIYDLDILNP